jgi:hypothetical protein
MSASWRLYLTERSGAPVSIVFDETAALDLKDAPQTHALRYKLTLKTPREDGLANREEAELLAVLDEAFEKTGAEGGARLIGRKTTQGARWMYLIASDPPQPLANILYTLATSAGYTAEVFYDPDPDKATYFTELYPTGEDWNTITDYDVLRTLAQKGDHADKVRGVDHSAYFPSQAGAERFADWARGGNMINVLVEAVPAPADPDLSWHVHATHNGTMKPDDITAWSKAVYRTATALGGRYGGWETDVV